MYFRQDKLHITVRMRRYDVFKMHGKRQLQTKIRKFLFAERPGGYYLARLCKIRMHVKSVKKKTKISVKKCDCLPKVTVITECDRS